MLNILYSKKADIGIVVGFCIWCFEEVDDGAFRFKLQDHSKPHWRRAKYWLKHEKKFFYLLSDSFTQIIYSCRYLIAGLPLPLTAVSPDFMDKYHCHWWASAMALSFDKGKGLLKRLPVQPWAVIFYQTSHYLILIISRVIGLFLRIVRNGILNAWRVFTVACMRHLLGFLSSILCFSFIHCHTSYVQRLHPWVAYNSCYSKYIDAINASFLPICSRKRGFLRYICKSMIGQ